MLDTQSIQTVPPTEDVDPFEQKYLLGRQLYEEGRYIEASPIFEQLFLGADPRGQRPAVAYALGQCRRLLGDFPGALSAYQSALASYTSRGGEASAWRSATSGQLSVVSSNLAAVTLIRPEDLETGTRLCSLRVDGRPSTRYTEAQLQGWLETDSSEVANIEHLKRIVAGLLDGGLFGADVGREVPAPASGEPCYDRDVTLVVDRTEDHVFEYGWHVSGRAPQRTVFPLTKAELESGAHVVQLARLNATLSVRYVKPGGEVLRADQVRRVAAFLAPAGEDAEIPIERDKPRAVAAGRYALFVNTTDWSASDPIHFTLRPGEERMVDVELDELRFYQQAWFPWALVGVAAGALLVSAQIMLSSDEGRGPSESRPAPIYTFDIP